MLEGIAVRKGRNPPTQDPFPGVGGIGFLDFSLTPRAQANWCVPGPEEGAAPRARAAPDAPKVRREWGGGCGRGTSRPVPAQSKLALGGAGPPARNFRAGPGVRAQRTLTPHTPANLPVGAR